MNTTVSPLLQMPTSYWFLHIPNRMMETTEAYQERVQKDYYDVSSISGIFKSFSDAPNGFKEEMQGSSVERRWRIYL